MYTLRYSLQRMALACLLFITASLAFAQRLSVGQYNVRYASNGDAHKGYGWKTRLPKIVSLVRYEDWDVIGIQEALHSQYKDLERELDDYGFVGVGRDDGATRGEYAPILYKKSRFVCHKHGTFWLSETPDEVGSKGWDAVLPRICTWVQLEDKDSGTLFWMFNLHMDHIGAVSRTESARLVLRKITELCADDPYILTGDFNVDQHSVAYAELVQSGKLLDTYEAAKYRMAENGTYNGFNPDKHNDLRIDHIFVSPQIGVHNYGILTHSFWSRAQASTSGENDARNHQVRVISDHYPVSAKIELKQSKKRRARHK